MKKLLFTACLVAGLAAAGCNSDKKAGEGDSSVMDSTSDTTMMDNSMTDTGTMDTIRRDSMDNRRVDTAKKMQP